MSTETGANYGGYIIYLKEIAFDFNHICIFTFLSMLYRATRY